MNVPAGGPAPAKRILLVDDDERVLFVLGASLTRLGLPCEVVTARDGREAGGLLNESGFDILVTDIRVPGIDGITLTGLARAQAPQLPVVWVTAYGCRELRADASRLRVFCCLEKPVELDEFRRIIRQALTETAGDPVGD